MKNKKACICVTLVLLLITLVVVFIKIDCNNYLRINKKYTYEEGWTFVVDNMEWDNASLYTRIFFQSKLRGARIYAMNDVGYMERVVDFYDCYIEDVVVEDECLKVYFCHYIDGVIEQSESMQVAEFDLTSLENYKTESYVNGEVMGFDKTDGNIMFRKDIFVVENLRSNLLKYEGVNILVDGQKLLVGNEGDYEEKYSFDKIYNFIELFGDTRGVFAVCSEDYKTIMRYADFQSNSVTELIQIAEDIIWLELCNDEMYILTESMLMKVDKMGNSEVVRTLEESNCNVFRAMEVDETIHIFGENIFEEIAGDNVKYYVLPEGVNVSLVVEEIIKEEDKK